MQDNYVLTFNEEKVLSTSACMYCTS